MKINYIIIFVYKHLEACFKEYDDYSQVYDTNIN